MGQHAELTETVTSMAAKYGLKEIANEKEMSDAACMDEHVQKLLEEEAGTIMYKAVDIHGVRFNVKDVVAFYDTKDSQCRCYQLGVVHSFISNNDGNISLAVTLLIKRWVEDCQVWSVKDSLEYRRVKISQLACHTPQQKINLPKPIGEVVAMSVEPTLSLM